MVRPPLKSLFVIAGVAPGLALVTLHFHQRGTPASDYSTVRTVQADASGSWSRIIVASIDYRYFVTTGLVSSPRVLLQIAPIMDGPTTRRVVTNRMSTLSGWAAAGTMTVIHLHRRGTPASDYSLVRTAATDAHGCWRLWWWADDDVRLYVSRDRSAPLSGPLSYLIQTSL